MREFATTLLDATGLLLVATGVAAGSWPYVGGWGLSLAGGVVLGGSWLAARNEAPA